MVAYDDSHGADPPVGTLLYSRRSPAPGVVMRYTTAGPWLVVEVGGELDLQAVPLLNTLGGEPHFVVLDLKGVTFMDCSGLHALGNAQRRALGAGGAVRLAAPSRHVLSLLRHTGLERAFPAFDTVSEATAAPGAGDLDGAMPDHPWWSSRGYQRTEQDPAPRSIRHVIEPQQDRAEHHRRLLS